jgi:hypothetical protein
MKALVAEQQTKADGRASFEIAFRRGRRRHEATFTAEGAFVEEE